VSADAELSYVPVGYSHLGHASVSYNRSALPYCRNADFNSLRMKTCLVYVVKISSCVYEPPDHSPLFMFETMFASFFFDDLKAQRFNLGRVNFSYFIHHLSPLPVPSVDGHGDSMGHGATVLRISDFKSRNQNSQFAI